MKSGVERIGRTVTVEFANRSCLDKRPYPSRNDARDAAARNLKTFGTDTKPYRCTLCGRFHLTTKRGKPPSRSGALLSPPEQSKA